MQATTTARRDRKAVVLKRGRRTAAVKQRKSKSSLTRSRKRVSGQNLARRTSRLKRSRQLKQSKPTKMRKRLKRTNQQQRVNSTVNSRQVLRAMDPVRKVADIQLYRGYSSEARLSHDKSIYKKKSLQAVGSKDAARWEQEDRSLSSFQLVHQMNQRFIQALELEGIAYHPEHVSYEDISSLGHSYVKGYADARNGLGAHAVLLPTTAKLAVVLCAYNEEDSIAAALAQLARLPLDEVVIVVNGSVDRTFELARQALPEAIVVHFEKRLGHDVGRAVGAKLLQADAVLFTDCDFSIEAEQLGAYLWSIVSGVDVALNDIRPFMDRFEQQDGLSYCKQWLNQELGRSDLAMNSMTAIPHALSSKAIQTIGYEALCVPPRAHALAVLHGLNVQTARAVDVITKNRLRTTNIGMGNPVAQLIIGDHMEALETVWNWKRDELNAVQSVRADIAWRRNQ